MDDTSRGILHVRVRICAPAGSVFSAETTRHFDFLIFEERQVSNNEVTVQKVQRARGAPSISRAARTLGFAAKPSSICINLAPVHIARSDPIAADAEPTKELGNSNGSVVFILPTSEIRTEPNRTPTGRDIRSNPLRRRRISCSPSETARDRTNTGQGRLDNGSGSISSYFRPNR